MVTPTQKIGRGLDAHARAMAGSNTPTLAVLAGITGDPDSISKICDSVKTARTRLVQLRAGEVKDAKAAAEAAKAGWRDRGVIIDESNIRTDTLGGTQRRKFVEADIRKAHKERLAATADERDKLAATLREAKESLDLIRDLWSSPVAVLMRSTLGSEKRATYAANLAAAGPKEVDDAMRVAVQTGDRDRAAAACVRIDGLGKEARKLLKFSKSDVAEHMVSDEYAKATEALGMADYYRESGDLVAREIEGRRVSPTDKIRVGRKLRELERKLGKSLDEKTGEPNPSDFKGRPGVNPDAAEDAKRMAAGLPPL